MILATASRLAAVALSGAALTFLAFAASGAPGDPTLGFVFQDEEPGYLGVTLGDEGLRIDTVIPATAAAAGGLQPGDVIVWIAGKDVETFAELVEVLQHHPPGTSVGLVYLRGDETRKTKLTLGSRDKPRLRRVEEDDAEHDRGSVVEHEEALRRVLGAFGEAAPADEPGFLGINLGSGEGVVVGSVIEGTAAAKAGLRAGDRIVQIDGERLGSLDDLRRVLATRPPGTRVQLHVQRGEKVLRIGARLGHRDGGAVPEPPPGEELRRRIEEELRRAVKDVPRTNPPVSDGSGFLGVFLDEAKDGAVVSGVVSGSAAARARLQAGDRIVAFDGRKIASGDALREAIAARAAGTRVVLGIARGDRPLRVELALGARDASETAPAPPEAAPRARVRSSTRVGAERQLREARRRLAEAEEGVGRILREDVAPQVRAAFQEMRETMGSLRAEVEGLRRELQALRQALRELRSGR